MSQDSRKDATLSDGPGHQVDKAPPAPSTLPEERDKPGMPEKGRAELATPKPAPGERTRDVDVGHRLKE